MLSRLTKFGTGCLLLTLCIAVAAAPTPYLTADGIAGGWGSNSSNPTFDQTVSPATSATLLSFGVHDPKSDGSDANVEGSVSFGTFKAMADAHRTFNVSLAGTPLVGNAQSHFFARFVDYLSASGTSSLGFASYTLTLAVSGSHSVAQTFGDAVNAGAVVNYDIIDLTTNTDLGFGTWESTDAVQAATITRGIVAPAGDLLQLRVDFDVSAFVMSNNVNPADLSAVSDYANTVHVYLDDAGGAFNTVGQSGYDYATPQANASVPEPSELLLALAALLGLIRRRSAVAHLH